MKIKKRMTKLLAFSLFCILFNGCLSPGLKTNFFTDSDKLKVLSTNRMIHDTVVEIAGDSVEALVLIDGPLDPHSYDLVKGDGDKINQANIIFANGLGLEHSLSLRKSLEGNSCSVFLGDLIFEKEPELFLSENGVVDPHIWMDLELWSKIVPVIVKVLSTKLPDLAQRFHQRGELLLKEMAELDNWALSVFRQIPEDKKYLITGHNAFRYFTRRYLAPDAERISNSWQFRCSSPEGISPEAQIGFRDITRVSSYILEHKIDVVFPENGLNRAALKKVIASVKGRRAVRFSNVCVYADNVGPADASFFDVFRNNVKIISEELSRE